MKNEWGQLAQYPLLRSRCESRSANGAGGANIEDHIADAVNVVLDYSEGPEVTILIRHLALAFLCVRALKQKGIA